MSKEKPIIPRGQPELGRRNVEKTVYFKFAMLESQHAHILTRAAQLNISAAEYIRRLIDADTSEKPAV